MRSCFIRICMVLFLSFSSAYTEVTLENGGYNVLVAFSQNVPLEIGMELIGRMETSLTKASEILYNAIGLQFSKVTFEVPEYWDVSTYNLNFEDSFNSDSIKADILIDGAEDTVFGKFPFAQQYGSCRVPGQQIIIPTVFFDDEHNRFPKGISLAREWLKYRYGVFDENGYFDDPLYPQYYNIPGSDANEVHVTDCSYTKIMYNFTDQQGEECPDDEKLIDKLKSQKCVLNIKEEDLENVTSSLMYFQESITSMIHICDDDHEHNSRSPNKQNALCNGKSIGDIISQSSDFNDKDKKEVLTDIQFVLSKKAKQRVVVAWENTKQLESKGQIILNAITKLMIDLPDGSKFNAFPFPLKENPPNDYYTLKDLDGVNTRKTIASEIKSEFKKVADGNYKDAVKKAIAVLKSAADNSAKPPGNVIIIKGTEEDLIVLLLKNDNECVTTFNKNTFPENINDITPNLPCIDVVQIPKSEEPEDTYDNLIKTIGRFCPSKVQDKLIEMLNIEYLIENEALEVEVDNFTETVTFSIFGDKDRESFKLELNGEIKKEIEEENYKNVLKLSYSPKEVGTIAFSSDYPIPESVLIEIKKITKPGKYFSGEIQVHDTTEEDDTDQMPVIIYAIVRFGSYPVQNAKVSAVIQRPDGEKDTLQLLDDGKGDPDITQNDGVYSRYYTNFTGKGDYTVRVLVKNNGFITRYGADKTADYRSCCGSYVSADGRHTNGDMPNLNKFVKVYQTTFTAKSARPDDGYKPSRITDLRIQVTDDGIILKWTAPGGEADSGKASRYEIKLFCGEENTTKCNIHKVIQVLNKPTPLSYGEDQQLEIKILDKTEILLISIITFNEKNKTSDLSNIVEIFRPSTLPEITTKEPVITAASNSKIGTIVGWVIAGILIIICIIGTVIYLRKRQQPEKPDIHNTEENKDNRKIKSTIEAKDISIQTASFKKNESFPVFLYTHDQIKEHKSKENNQPLYKSNESPKQWKGMNVISTTQRY